MFQGAADRTGELMARYPRDASGSSIMRRARTGSATSRAARQQRGCEASFASIGNSPGSSHRWSRTSWSGGSKRPMPAAISASSTWKAALGAGVEFVRRDTRHMEGIVACRPELGSTWPGPGVDRKAHEARGDFDCRNRGRAHKIACCRHAGCRQQPRSAAVARQRQLRAGPPQLSLGRYAAAERWRGTGSARFEALVALGTAATPSGW